MRPGVIITGADGFIGAATTNYFLSQGWRVLALDINYQPKRLQKHPNLIYRVCDLRPGDFYSNADWNGIWGQYDYFINLAWEGSAGSSRVNLDLQITNARTTANCVKFANFLGCKKFVCAGSLMEYEVEEATHNNKPVTSVNYYGFGKQLAHLLAKAEGAKGSMSVIWVIITNVYGPGETSSRFINTTIKKILNKEPLHFSSATQNYDFVYIDDAARAFANIAIYGRDNEEYLLGSGHAKPLKEFITTMINTLDPTAEPIFHEEQICECGLPLGKFSGTKTQAHTGFTANVPFEKGIKATADWIKENNNA